MACALLGITPLPGVDYPCNINYCGNCTMPIEYCQYYPFYEKCKVWLQANLPTEFDKLSIGSNKETKVANQSPGEGTSGQLLPDEDKKRQKRGGKGMVKVKKKENQPQGIVVFVAPRGKKRNTVISGLKTYNIDLKVASKFFGTKFACGSSVTGDDEIVIQGDIKDELIDIVCEKWPEIDEDSIEDGGEHKR